MLNRGRLFFTGNFAIMRKISPLISRAAAAGQRSLGDKTASPPLELQFLRYGLSRAPAHPRFSACCFHSWARDVIGMRPAALIPDSLVV